MGKPLNGEYRAGQVVVSKRGKDAGHRYVIVGFLGEKRLALADADKFNVDRPKPKNPRHVTRTPLVVDLVAACADAGKNINRGELCRFLRERLRAEDETEGRVAYGEQGDRK